MSISLEEFLQHMKQRKAAKRKAAKQEEAGKIAEVKDDADRLRLKREQTKEVAELLEEVFAEDVAEPEPEAEEAPDFYGLDAPYKNILVALGEQDAWDKDSFNTLAEKFGLMPSGVLESLNDAALDNFDDEVLFEEENIEVNREVLEEMVA